MPAKARAPQPLKVQGMMPSFLYVSKHLYGTVSTIINNLLLMFQRHTSCLDWILNLFESLKRTRVVE